MNKGNRKHWIDISKGIAIVLMVLGHTSIPDTLSRFIFAFHMPLFFMASGYTSNWDKYDVCYFIRHKIRTILLPFTLYSIVVAIVMEVMQEQDVMALLKNGWGGYALWFVPVLFLASVTARLVRIAQRLWIRYTLLVALLTVGGVLCHYKFSLPWALATVPYATFFVLFGSELAQIKHLIEKDGGYYDILLLAAVTFVISHYYRLDMAWNNILPLLPITVGAIAGTLLVFRFSFLLWIYTKQCSQFLQSIGRETFIIMAFSQVLIIGINHFCDINPIWKYFMLILLLIGLKYLKDGINKIAKFKIL